MAEPVNTTPNPAPGPGGADAQVSGTAAVDDANKVFAGNLAFATTEDELKAVFAEVGTVNHIQIIKRGTRSLGYGFVTYATEAEAQKAVQTLDKKEIAGREINVEGAKPQLAAKHNDSGNYSYSEGEGGAKSGAGRGRGRGRARRGRGGRGGASSRRPRTDEGEEELDDSAKENGDQNAGNGESKASRKAKKAAANGTSVDGEKPARQPRKPKGPPEGEPSKTLLFVANLPFQFTDEQLLAAFDGFKVKTAKVIKRRFGSRTKGFGFVDLEDEEEQQRALKEANGLTVEGRALSLKVAIQGQDRTAAAEADEETEAKAEAAAEALGAPAA